MTKRTKHEWMYPFQKPVWSCKWIYSKLIWPSMCSGSFPDNTDRVDQGWHWSDLFPDHNWYLLFTFEVQVTSSIGVLSNGAWVNFERMYIVGIPGHHHVVPLVVAEGLVWVALHQWRPIAKIKDIVDKPVGKKVGDCICVSPLTSQVLKKIGNGIANLFTFTKFKFSDKCMMQPYIDQMTSSCCLSNIFHKKITMSTCDCEQDPFLTLPCITT